MTTVSTEFIPPELRTLRQWIVWRMELRGDKNTKVPYRIDGNRAKATEPADWTDYETALAASERFDGIGFVFAKDGGMTGIDLDDCMVNGKPKPWASAILDRFPTYAEVSPSGNGVKLWCRGKLPSDTGTRRGYRDGAIEMYDWGRFFTVTGQRFGDSPLAIADCQNQINGLHSRIVEPQAAPPAPPIRRATATVDDQTIIEKLLSEHGDKAARLWSGDTSGYVSESEADAGLCCKIAFYTGPDPSRIESVFNQSMLVRGKWTDRADYRKRTISGALAKVTTFYDWTRSPKATAILPPAQSDGLLKLIEETISGKRQNAPWGTFASLTRSARALLPGTVTVVCGGGGSTKSLFLSQSCLAWLQSDLPFAVMHLEEDREHHTYRALAQLEGNSKITDDEYVRDNPDIVRSAYDEHMSTLDALSSRIWDAPLSDMPIADLTDWVRDRAAEGNRIIAIDPVTAADSGSEPWKTDKQFVLNTKRLMRDHDASLIVVTHPRDGNLKNGGHLDNMAGGKAYNRFTTAVLWMTAMAPQELRCVSTFGRFKQAVNRTIQISKTRNGPGNGWKIGYRFDSETLCFSECGVIQDDE